MNKITICSCASRTFIDKTKVAKVAAAAQRAGIEVCLTADLCELCQKKSEAVHDIALTTVVACHPRAVKSLMAFVGEENVKTLNLRTGTAEDVLQALGIKPVEGVADVAALNWRGETSICISSGWTMDLCVGGRMTHRLEKVVYNLDV